MFDFGFNFINPDVISPRSKCQFLSLVMFISFYLLIKN